MGREVLSELLPLEKTCWGGSLGKALPEVLPSEWGMLFPVFDFAFFVVLGMLRIFAALEARDAAGLVPIVVAPSAVHFVWVVTLLEVDR